MFLKLALSVGLLTAVGLAPAFAQTTSDARSPVAGDPGSKPVTKPHRPFIRKHAVVSDKPAAGSTNGNSPDRAAAAAGGR